MPVTQKSLLAVNDPQMYVAAYVAINSKKTYSSMYKTTHIVSPAIQRGSSTSGNYYTPCIGGGGQVMFCSMGLWALINSYDMTVHACMVTKHSKNTVMCTCIPY